MSGEQTGIVWKKFPGLPMADGRGAGTDKAAPDYSRFGARFQRETSIRDPGSAFAVYEMPDDLLRAPTPLELQLFEPSLYLPEAPTVPARLSSPLGRLHARIFWSVGNSGPMRLDCDWQGSVPLVAHKSLNVAVVADQFSTATYPTQFVGDYNFSDGTSNADPGTNQISFDALFPEAGTPINSPPTFAYLNRVSVAGDPAVFTSTQTNQRMKMQLHWGSGNFLHFWVASVEEHATYLKIGLAGLSSLDITMPPEALGDGDPLDVTLTWDDAPVATRIDVAVGLVIGSRPAPASPTYTYPATPLATTETASFPVPAFARRLRLAIKWGEAEGSAADAALGQYFVAFISRGFGALGWIDAASAREALFGEGLPVPPGTHAVMFDNRSPDALDVMPSFVLEL
jgi:hypothetical protein